MIESLTDKLVRRHPYVFAGDSLPRKIPRRRSETARAQIKANEKAARRNQFGARQCAQSDARPGARAVGLTARGSSRLRVAEHPEPVWGKVEEEMAELKQAGVTGDKARTGEEFGESAVHDGQRRALSRYRVRRGAGADSRSLYPALSSHRSRA